MNASGKNPAYTEDRLFKEEMSELIEQSVSKTNMLLLGCIWAILLQEKLEALEMDK